MKGKPGEWFQDDHVGGYFDENVNFVVCEEYELTDADTDRFSVEIQNGDGYYDKSNSYCSYHHSQKGQIQNEIQSQIF